MLGPFPLDLGNLLRSQFRQVLRLEAVPQFLHELESLGQGSAPSIPF